MIFFVVNIAATIYVVHDAQNLYTYTYLIHMV